MYPIHTSAGTLKRSSHTMAAIFVATLADRAPYYTVTIDVAPHPLLASAPPLDRDEPEWEAESERWRSIAVYV